jgi:hypothetical protein
MRVMGALALAACLVAIACDGDGTGATKGTGAKRSIQPEAQKRAEAMVLLLSDFPEGWRASPSEDTTAIEAKYRTCLGDDYSTLTIIGDADSRTFEIGDAAYPYASSTTSMYASEGQAQAALQEWSDGLQSDGAEDCFRTLTEQGFTTAESREFKVDEVDLGDLNVPPAREVEETRAWRVARLFEVTSGESKGESATAYSDFVVLRDGASLATIEASDIYSPFLPPLRNKLVQAVADRMSEEED